MDKRARALFAGAERSAERLVGQLRMATSLSLGLLFAITVLARAGHTDAVLPMQIVAAISTLGAYLGLGAASYRLASQHRFRPWKPWATRFLVAAAGECPGPDAIGAIVRATTLGAISRGAIRIEPASPTI